MGRRPYRKVIRILVFIPFDKQAISQNKFDSSLIYAAMTPQLKPRESISHVGSPNVGLWVIDVFRTNIFFALPYLERRNGLGR